MLPRSEGARRMRARFDGPPMRPAESVAQRLQIAYRATVEQWIAIVLRVVADEWHTNTVAHGPGGYVDSSSWTKRKLQEIDRLMLGAPTDEILRAGQKADERNAKAFSAQLKTKDVRSVAFGYVSKRLKTVGLRSAMGARIDEYRRENVRLIKSLRGEQIEKVRELLDQGEAEGWRPEQMRKRLQEDLEISKSRADLIARDQTLKLSADLTQARQTGSGIRRYVWRTAGDERVRGTPGGKWPNGLHYELDGQECSWDDPPITNDNGDRNHPGQDYQCRCTAEPILPDISELPDLEEQ